MNETDLDACLDEAELAQDLRDHCLVDLRACQFRLDVRTPTVAAQLVQPPPPPEPVTSGLELPLVIALIIAGLGVGAAAGALAAR